MAKGDYAKKEFTTLPGWAKGVIAVVIVGGVSFVAYKLYKGLKDKTSGKAKGDRQEDRGWNKEFDKLNSNPSTKATMSQAQMLSYANSLHTAMDGLGTDEDAIIAVFKNVKNDADFAGLSAAYGTRVVNSGIWGFSDYNGSLSGALTSELSLYWKDIINKNLASKKVTYRV